MFNATYPSQLPQQLAFFSKTEAPRGVKVVGGLFTASSAKSGLEAARTWEAFSWVMATTMIGLMSNDMATMILEENCIVKIARFSEI